MYLILLFAMVGCSSSSDREFISNYQSSRETGKGELILRSSSEVKHCLYQLSKLKYSPNIQHKIPTKARAIELVAKKGVGLDLSFKGEHYGYLMVVLHAFLDVDNPELCRHWMTLEGLRVGTEMESHETWHEISNGEINIFGRATLVSRLGIVEITDVFSIREEVSLTIFYDMNK